MILDAHQHFWRYNPAEFGWLDDGKAALRRDFLPGDLAAELRAAGVQGTMAVQARPSLAETEWLLELARAHSFIRGVVGWAPLAGRQVRRHLERLAAEPGLRGLRHLVQDEPDDGYILRPDFNRGVALLREFGLAYDLLVYERHLPRTIRFVDRHPGQVFVLDHAAKPRVRERRLEPWRTNLRELARRPNVYCKLSGLVTEAHPARWTPARLRPYIETALEAFGPRRLMFGSDWPVCLAACPYGRWLDIVRNTVANLSAAERRRVLGGTAAEAYGLGKERA